ncbi:MAG TPA: sulfatase [Bryobacteraceae bacterium]|jgi:arylsulfatase A-like enzyme
MSGNEINGRPPNALRSGVRSTLMGAVWGMLAWQAYAVTEFAFATITPEARYHMPLEPWYWKLSLILLVFYSVAGLAAGGIFSGLVRVSAPPFQGSQRDQTLGTLTLVVAFLANLVVAGGLRPAVIAALALAGVLIWACVSESASRRFALLGNAWVAASFLLITAWADNEGFSQRNIVVRLGIVAMVAAAFAVLSSWGRRFRNRRSPSAAIQGALVLAGVLLVCGCGLWFSRDAPIRAGSNEAVGKASGAARDSSRPNVLLVTMDTVRADHLSLYGYARNTSPNLAKLAQTSTVFSHPVAAGNGTLTSHAALLTGVYTSWNGARSNDGVQIPISKNFPTLAELILKQGYSTAAFVANCAYLIPSFGFDRGFQTFESQNPLKVLPPGKAYCLRSGARAVLNRFIDTAEFDLQFLRAAEINRRAFQFLDREPVQSQPFFVFLNYMDAHQPYVPPAPYNTLFPVGGGSSQLRADFDSEGQDGHSPLEIASAISQYDGGIAYIDDQIGKLLQHLKELGLYDNTLIIITGDHGEAFGERGYYGHGATVYQSVVSVPLLIKYPGTDEGKRLDSPAGHVDIVPTVLDLTASAPPKLIQGHSLKGNEGDPARVLFSESFTSHPKGNPKRNLTERALYAGNFKYVGSATGARELYDLSADPEAAHDICFVDASRCDQMERQLAAWTAGIPAQALSGIKLPQKSVELLKSLGYIGK